MAASPSSSPRLPSPPPIAEDQLGPKSPIAMPNEHGELARNPFEANASRRIRPGTKATDMALGPPLVPLTDIDSPFQLTEHLKSLHNAALHRDNSTTISPIDRETATRLAHPPEGVDKYLWLYELCRLLCKEINAMIVALFQDEPPCSAQTCSEMRASEWQYLCAVHDPPKPCCAIDYCCHTLDWTNHVLTSQKNFPSRLTLGDAGGSQSATGQLRQLTNIFRRVYRIFAHAWFQHREMYWKVELKSGLYIFFKTVCDVYNLIPEDNYTVPPEAEGIEPINTDTDRTRPSIMKRKEEASVDHEKSEKERQQPRGTLSVVDGAKTKRHRSTPSVGSESITTVMEDPEEDEEKANGHVEETIILVDEPPEHSAIVAELSGEEQPTTGKDQESVSSELEEDTAAPPTQEVDVPTVAVEEATTATEQSEQPNIEPILPTKGEAEAEADSDVEPADASDNLEVGGKDHEASSTTSDTDSHDSWQVLSNEPQPSSSSDRTTPATSVTDDESTEMAEEEKNETEAGPPGSGSFIQAEGEAEHEPVDDSKTAKQADEAEETISGTTDGSKLQGENDRLDSAAVSATEGSVAEAEDDAKVEESTDAKKAGDIAD